MPSSLALSWLGFLSRGEFRRSGFLRSPHESHDGLTCRVLQRLPSCLRPWAFRTWVGGGDIDLFPPSCVSFYIASVPDLGVSITGLWSRVFCVVSLHIFHLRFVWMFSLSYCLPKSKADQVLSFAQDSLILHLCSLCTGLCHFWFTGWAASSSPLMVLGCSSFPPTEIVLFLGRT